MLTTGCVGALFVRARNGVGVLCCAVLCRTLYTDASSGPTASLPFSLSARNDPLGWKTTGRSVLVRVDSNFFRPTVELKPWPWPCPCCSKLMLWLMPPTLGASSERDSKVADAFVGERRSVK